MRDGDGPRWSGALRPTPAHDLHRPGIDDHDDPLTALWRCPRAPGSVAPLMGSLIKKRRKRMRKKKHKKMLKRTRWQRRAAGK